MPMESNPERNPRMGPISPTTFIKDADTENVTFRRETRADEGRPRSGYDAMTSMFSSMDEYRGVEDYPSLHQRVSFFRLPVYI